MYTNKKLIPVMEKKLKNNLSNNKKTLGILVTNIITPYNILIYTILLFLILFYFKVRDPRLLLDAYGVTSLVTFNTLIAIIQELRAKRALEKVQLLNKKTAIVIRDNKQTEIPIEEIEVNDTIFIQNGDQIVADGKVVKSSRLEINESLLTGESDSILKTIDSKVLSGSYVSSGSGYFIVEKIGNDSYAGKINKEAKYFKFTSSPLQIKINNIIKILVVVSLLLIGLKVASNWKDGALQVHSIREYITILIALIPQGLILLSTITYAIGIYKISKIGAIVQKITAIEAFSAVNIVCMDKTGTLTENKISIQSINNLSKLDDINLKKLISTYANTISYKNATSNALLDKIFFEDTTVIDELPFNSEYKMSILKLKIQGDVRLFILGAFDILKDNIKNTSVLEQIDNEEIKYFRNLLFLEVNSFDEKTDLKDFVKEFPSTTPLAVISLADTVRKDAIQAIKLFTEKNVQIKILSGDSPNAIRAILNKIGWIIHDNDIINGNDLATDINDESILQKKVFARLTPEQKKEIIKSLKDKHYFTAMIGDGVNDLPAMKESNLSIAMEEGSQITKEISDIILINNKFSLLPNIFNEGNRIVNSVELATKLFLTKNFAIALLTILSITTGLSFIFTPRTISFMTIFIITFPSVLISIYNRDYSKHNHLIKDIIKRSIISSIILLIFGYIGYYGSPIIFKDITIQNQIMLTIAVMIFLSISNFLSIVINNNMTNKEKYIYIIYSIILLILLFILTTVHINNILVMLFNILYEISYINVGYWPFIILLSTVGSSLLYLTDLITKRSLKEV